MNTRDKKNNLSGILCVLAAGSMWGLMGIFVRNLNRYGISSMQIVAIRVIICAVVMGIYLYFYDKSLLRVKLKDMWCFVGTGIISVFFFSYCYFKTMTLTSLSIAAVLLYTAPVFVMFFSAVLFKERITLKKICAGIIAIVGCGLAAGIADGAARVTLTGLFFGILSGVLYALYSIFGRFALNRGYKSLTITFYTFLFAFPLALVFGNMGGAVKSFELKPITIVVSVLMGLITTVFPYILYTKGLSKIEPGKASVIASIEPVIATLVGIFIFKEQISAFGIAGVLLVISAIILIELRGEKQ